MTRSELIQRLTERNPQLLHQDAEMSVTVILAAIHNTLAKGERLEIRGFGSFGVRSRAQRKGRNPRTGEPVAVCAQWVPYFRAGKELRIRVDYSVQPKPLRLAA